VYKDDSSVTVITVPLEGVLLGHGRVTRRNPDRISRAERHSRILLVLKYLE
jgi:hypothetical protein